MMWAVILLCTMIRGEGIVSLPATIHYILFGNLSKLYVKRGFISVTGSELQNLSVYFFMDNAIDRIFLVMVLSALGSLPSRQITV